MIFVFFVATSIISGTLANYSITINNLAKGSSIAKEFIFLEDGADTFKTDVKIAPNESVTWQFAVKNFEDKMISETEMNLKFAVDVLATEKKQAIEPLIVTVSDQDAYVIAKIQVQVPLNLHLHFSFQKLGRRSCTLYQFIGLPILL